MTRNRLPSTMTEFRVAPSQLRRAITLVELLVVIVILGLITAATVPILAPAVEGARQREAARLVGTVFSNAQARAIASGKPYGVWIERDPGTMKYAATTLYNCEVPPPYGGETANTRVWVDSATGPSTNYTYCQVVRDTGQIAPRIARTRDLIQFAHRGPWFEIDPSHKGAGTHDADGDGYIDDNAWTPAVPVRVRIRANSVIKPSLYPSTVVPSVAVPFLIMRQPERSSQTPTRLPEGSVIDLRFSGVGASEYLSTANNDVPLIVLFSPNGSVQSFYANKGTVDPLPPAADIQFLIGKAERVWDDTAEPSPLADPSVPDQEDELLNFQDMENLWVTVHRDTGMVTTAQVGANSALTMSTTTVAKALEASRSLAAQTRHAGGR